MKVRAMESSSSSWRRTWWWMLLLVQILGATWVPCVESQSGVISLGSKLSGEETWLSQNGTFTMGFHAIPANSSNLYVGVWYSGVPITPVWLLNRETPVKPGASLSILKGGNITLVDGDGSQVWASDTAVFGVTEAIFLENGNLVLRNASGATVFDSFDILANTFLPGMYIRVGEVRRSWKSTDDPSPGLYSFQIMENGELHFYWNSTDLYYNSGLWAGNYYTNPPHLGQATPPDKFYYDNSTGSPTIHYTTEGRNVTKDISLKRFTLDADGNARQHIWSIEANDWQTFINVPNEPCDTYHTCGQNTVCNNSNTDPVCNCLPGFEVANTTEWNSKNYWLHGCRRINSSSSSSLQCSHNSSEVSFLALTNVVFEEDITSQTYSNDTESSCKERCLRNCTCGGYSYSTASGCTIQATSSNLYNAKYTNGSSTSFFLRNSVAAASPSPVSAPSSHGQSTFRGTKLIVTVVVVFVGVVLFAMLVACWLWRCMVRKRSRAGTQASEDMVGLLRFSYKELVEATSNFSKQLGSGGFGTVYKGALLDKSEVAVKTLGKLRQGEQEFRTEVGVIGTIQHINLVRLHGFCAEGDHRALVYECVPNGSLERYLFTKNHQDKDGQQVILDWKTRLNIALGAARGIAYLHHECRYNIIHCDIKPENILLDTDFAPKVSDFGLAKLLGKDVSRIITNIRGTRGYLAPEWLTNLTLTSKVDVYSFGMTLLELVSGRRTVDLSYPSEKWFYAVWAFNHMQNAENELRSVVDDRLPAEEVDEEELRRTLRVGLWCTQDDPEKRPSMRDVVKMLEGTLDVTDAPSPPTYAQTAKLEDLDLASLQSGSTASIGSPRSQSETTDPSAAHANAPSTVRYGIDDPEKFHISYEYSKQFSGR